MSGALERDFIEIFRAGDYTAQGKGVWTVEMLDRIADAYNPEKRHAAPVVLGHPTEDAPAYGWVKRLRRVGESLWAQLTKVAPEFEELVRSGRYLQRSASFYRDLNGLGPYLRHLGFLGATPPQVKGLAPILAFRELGALAVDFADTPAGMRPTETVACARFTLSPGMRVCGVELADDATLVEKVEKVNSYGEALRLVRQRWPES